MILHILKKRKYDCAINQNRYSPSSLKEEGFIHCSTIDQIVKIANSIYRYEDDICVMVLSEEKLEAKLVYEDLYDSNELYPHIYGPLNMDACIEVYDLPCGAEGYFEFPAGLERYN